MTEHYEMGHPHARVVAALKAILQRYLELATSGDCGYWDPYDEPEVKEALFVTNQTRMNVG